MVRQYSAARATRELENFAVDRDGVTALELEDPSRHWRLRCVLADGSAAHCLNHGSSGPLAKSLLNVEARHS
jgi:hypothetical protein